MNIKISKLKVLLKKILLNKFKEDYANLITNVLIFGELSGKKSHGISLLFGDAGVLNQKDSGITIDQRTKFSEIINGNGNPGVLVASLAMLKSIKIAKKNGFSIVGTHSTFSSSGCLSYYLEKIAKENLICLIMAQSAKSTVVHGGVEPILGTNPISFGIPSNPNQLIFDMATSATTLRNIINLKNTGKRLPSNTAIDEKGEITINPNEALKGAILPFCNYYKGTGLAMIVEVLSGILTGASFSGNNSKNGWGNLFIVFSPDLLMDINEFKDKVMLFVETIRNSKVIDNNKIRIIGENTIRIRNENLERGEVEIQNELLELIEKCNRETKD